MFNKAQPIGVIDSGVGGLTVVKELRKILPNEDIIYFGDSANCPYGNYSKEKILELTVDMLKYLKSQNVKAVAIACNTISTLIEEYQDLFDYNIIGIVSPVANYVVRENLDAVGLIATQFTVSTGNYTKLIHEQNPSIEVVAKGSPLLAGLVDRGDFNKEEINAEITEHVDYIIAQNDKIGNVILGCTHYPIVEENFKECYPNLGFINPAYEQAAALKDYLAQENLINDNGGKLGVYSSGDTAPYATVCNMLGITDVSEYKSI